MIAVIDTSALIRLFIPDGPVPEGLDSFMRGTERGVNQAIAPELLLAEAANVINKKVSNGELSHSEGSELLGDILDIPIRLFSHRPLILKAYEIAFANGLSVYDALFLSTALHYGAVVFTGDRKLLNAANKMNLSPS